MLGGQLPLRALRLDRNISPLGVARAERAVWREVAGKGRGHNPHWPLSQAHHSGRIIYDSDPMGIPLLGETANPRPLNGNVLPQGRRGTSSIYGAATDERMSALEAGDQTHSPVQTLPV